MNRIIILVEPEKFLYEKFKEIAKDENDTIYFVSKKFLNEINDDKILKLDLINDYSNSIKVIKEIINDECCVFTASEVYFSVTQKLKKELSSKHTEDNEYIQFRDKNVMKQYFEKNSVTTAKSKYYSNIKEVRNDKDKFNYPMIIKPIGGFASCGVKKIDSYEILEEHIKKITLLNKILFSKSVNAEGVLVEEFIDGDEYSIDTIWFNGVPIIDGILSKGNDKGPYFPDRIYCTNPEINKTIKDCILSESHNAVKALGNISGATHTEIRIMNEKAYIIEVALRPGAGAFFYEVFSKAYNVDFYRPYYYSYVCTDLTEFQNKCTSSDLTINNVDKYMWYNISFKGSGVLKTVKNIDKIRDREEVIVCNSYLKPGDIIQAQEINSRYLCCIVAKISDDDCLRGANEQARIYDSIIEFEFEGA